MLAEVELKQVDQKIELPDWVRKEVTDDPRYRKTNLQHMVDFHDSLTGAQMTVN